MQYAPDGCHECGYYISPNQGLCPQCKQVRTCAQCAQKQHVIRRHSAVCLPVDFSITAPTNVVEQVVAGRFGGLGAVHQYVTMLAYVDAEKEIGKELAAWAGKSKRMAPIELLAGVIYNDFPGEDEGNESLTYVAKYLTPIDPNKAYYITDRRFLWQPNADVTWASAAVYKRVPQFLMTMAGIKRTTMESADAMLKRRVAVNHVNYHFLRATADETPDETRRRAITTARLWYRRALEFRNLFLFGHIWHQIEDSFSPAHTARSLASTKERPYGTVDNIYFFGDQTEEWHSRHESWDAVRQAGSPGDRRVKAAVPALRDSLKIFISDLSGAPLLPPDGKSSAPDREVSGQRAYAEARATRFAEWLEATVYAFSQRLL